MRLAARRARPAGRVRRRPHHRRADGQRHRARRGAPRAAGARGLGRRGAGPERRAAAAGGGRRGGARDAVARAAAARHRRARRSRSCRPTTRARCAPTRWRPRRPGDRVRAGGQRQHAARSTRSAEIAAAAREHGAWVHVDGAFGLWAAASPALAPADRGRTPTPTRGRPTATSGSTSPTTAASSAIRDAAAHAAAMGMSAAYLVRDADARSNSDWAPEASRRGRGFAVYAALRSLGRARRGGAGRAQLRARAPAGSSASRARSRSSTRWCSTRSCSGSGTTTCIRELQREGTFWAGGTVWHGRPALRFSVSNWSTTEADIDTLRRRDPQRGSASARVRVATTSSGSSVSCRSVIRITR